MPNNMVFNIVTIFPDIFKSYFKESIIKRAQKKGLIKIRIHNLRDFANDRHRTVDDRPYGGGPGMVMRIEPIIKSAQFTKSEIESLPPRRNPAKYGKKSKVILFSPAGKQFNNKMAAQLAKDHKQLILICGRYEGIDERAKKVIRNLGFKFQELSVGPYVLTGGELAAMILVDVVSRHIPGVLGKQESLEEKRFGPGVPVYTRPEVFTYKKRKYQTPKVLLSGHHKKIEEWRQKHIRKQ